MAISNDIKLAVYNGALNRFGSRRLASLTEARKPRRVLDQFWGSSDELISFALEQGDWNFAMRASQIEASTVVTPAWGFTYAFDKPTDYARLSSLSGDEHFGYPLTAKEYTDETDYWYADIDPIYVKYVSTHADYGFDSGKWSPGFREYVECRLAWLACYVITKDKVMKRELEADMREALKTGKSNDAMGEGVKFLPSGSWSRSRSSRYARTDKVNSLP